MLFQCPSCGASVELPEGRLSDTCAFCETPLVAASTQGEREPIDAVAPFVLDKGNAAQRLKQHLGGRIWAPEAVRRAVRPEELGAVLVPHYCYDARARSDYEAELGLWYYTTQTYTVIVNGRPQTRTRQVRHTEWLPTQGSHVHQYRDHLVSGSRGLPEAEANEIEPFDLGQALPYSPALLAGVQAERPTVDHDQARQTASQELTTRENALIRGFLPGDEVRGVRNQTRVEVEAVRLVLLPVWIAVYHHGGKPIRLLVNGQTGEVVGKVPTSWAKIGCAIGFVLLLLLLVLGCMGLLGAVGELLSRHGRSW